MTNKTLEQVMNDAMGRIVRREATQSDLAVVFLMSEWIDVIGGSAAARLHIPALEVMWAKAKEEYARGEV